MKTKVLLKESQLKGLIERALNKNLNEISHGLANKAATKAWNGATRDDEDPLNAAKRRGQEKVFANYQSPELKPYFEKLGITEVSNESGITYLHFGTYESENYFKVIIRKNEYSIPKEKISLLDDSKQRLLSTLIKKIQVQLNNIQENNDKNKKNTTKVIKENSPYPEDIEYDSKNDYNVNLGDLVEYDIPSWAMSALINGDYSGLEDEDETKLNYFVQKVMKQYGNANFMMNDIEGEDNLGFRAYNDIDNLGDNVYRLYIRPSSVTNESKIKKVVENVVKKALMEIDNFKVLLGVITSKKGNDWKIKGDANESFYVVRPLDGLLLQIPPEINSIGANRWGYEQVKSQIENLINQKEGGLIESDSTKKYVLTVKHDKGKIKLNTTASSEAAAIKQIMDSEGCPRSAILKCELKGDVIKEGVAQNIPKIEKYVNQINELISQAVDSDGDRIGVVDPTSTYELEWIYEPMIYRNGALKIVSYPVQKTREVHTDIIKSRDMEFDGIPTLQLISRMYKKALKNKDKISNKEIE